MFVISEFKCTFQVFDEIRFEAEKERDKFTKQYFNHSNVLFQKSTSIQIYLMIKVKQFKIIHFTGNYKMILALRLLVNLFFEHLYEKL